MSYSFSVQGATPEEALQKVSAEIEKIVVAQPAHQHDRVAILSTAAAYLGALTDDPSKDVALSVSGSVSWSGADNAVIYSAGISCSAYLVTRERTS